MPSSTGTLVFNDQKIQAPDIYATESLGVGVSDPTSNLEVVGNAYVSSNLEVGTANLFVDTVSGRVGVGTASPSAKLDVRGSAMFSSGVECKGTFIHPAFAFHAIAVGGQIVSTRPILSDTNSTITVEFDLTPPGTSSSRGFRTSGGPSNNQGVYFAPISGIYHVSCKARLSDGSTAEQEIQWYIKRTNGGEDNWEEGFEMWISPSDASGRRASMSSTIVKLVEGEGIFPRGDGTTTSLNKATFSGHFLGTY